MSQAAAAPDRRVIDAFIVLCGVPEWRARQATLGQLALPGSFAGRGAQRRHALELALGRLHAGKAEMSGAERRLLGFAREAVLLARSLPAAAQVRLQAQLLAGLTGEGTLIPLFHLLRTAARARAHGFEVSFPGLANEAPHDLLLRRAGKSAEVICETVSAEDGRAVHRGDWWALVDAINPALQTWLAAHPGRYLLKVTLPAGLAGPDQLTALQARITALLAEAKRQDEGAAAILKLDPLVLAGAQAGEGPQGLPARLRAQFGPEAHLAVTTAPGSTSVFALAARAGQENAIAGALCRRLEVAATRLAPDRPGILAVFLDDLDRLDWRALRERLELEGAVRRFLTGPVARRVAAVSCASRFEMFETADAVPEGELRFRNPAHPAARDAALAPALQCLV
jgi:hypothetical protein